MTKQQIRFTREYDIMPQLQRGFRPESIAGRKRDMRVRAVFLWVAIAVGLLFWAGIALGISLFSLNLLTT